MKKICFVLVFLFAFLFTGCDNNPPADKTNNQTETSSETNSSDSASAKKEEQKERYQALIPIDELYNEKEFADYAKKMIGTEAPDFSLVNLKGEKVKLSDYKGKQVILELANTQCPACISIQPDVDAFKGKVADVVFIGAYPLNNKQEVEEFINSTDSKHNDHLLFGEQPNKILEQFSVRYYPTFLFIDEDGIIRLVHVGGLDQELLNLLTELAFQPIEKEE